jgi:hypothetical protein
MEMSVIGGLSLSDVVPALSGRHALPGIGWMAGQSAGYLAGAPGIEAGAL